MKIHGAPAGFCGQRAVRQPAAGGAAAVLRPRDVRDRADPVAVVRRPPRDRADQRSVGADDPLVRIAPRAARARAASVHAARGAPRARHRHRCSRCATARSSIRSRCSSAAELFRGAIEDRYVERVSRHAGAGDSPAVRAPICSRPRSKCCGSRRSPATRTVRSRRACCVLDNDDGSRARPVRRATDLAYRYSQALTGDQELLPAVRRHRDAVPRQPRRLRARHRRTWPATHAPMPLEVPCPTRVPARTRSRPSATRRSASSSARRTRSRCSRRACRSSASATRAGTCWT